MAGLTGASGVQSAPPTQRPLPFDPLSADEQTRAIDLALAVARGQGVLSSHHAVIGAALYTDKTFRDLPEWPRVAEVWFYDYDAEHAVRVFVDLDYAVAMSFEALDVQPPLTGREIDGAGRTALERPDVQAALAGRGLDPDGIDWTARLWSNPSCPEARCALVGFSDGLTFVHDFMALVNLSTGQVVEIMDEASPEGGP